ncbi:MAG: hypothetical protein CMJ64_29090 [Planctomycetaceae bacterium]|nr:hypothetical protein [Planctomycetaceae bacterium]
MGRLPVAQQRQVLEFAKTLTTPVQGVNGAALIRFAGAIGVADLDSMSAAIDEGCERIDADAW